jgi:apolipoprotein N-acyltransferase
VIRNIIWFLIALFSIILFWLWKKMSLLPLWGHLPLAVFVLSWGVFLLLLVQLKYKDKASHQLILLSILSGVVLALGFPPLPLTPVLFVGFIPLFILFKKIKTEELNYHSWFFVFNAFVIWNILTTYWVANASFVPGIVAIWLNSFFMTIPWLGAIRIGKRLPKWRWISFIIFWLCFEWIHLNWEMSWPWLTLGNAWAALPQCIQWYEYTGVFGGGVWVLGVNVLLYYLFFDSNHFTFDIIWIRQKLFSKLGVASLIVLILPFIVSMFLWFNFKETGTTVEVGVVQPNYEPHYEKFKIPEDQQLFQIEKLAAAAVTPNTKFVIFPETSFGEVGGVIRKNNINQDPRIIRLFDFMIAHYNVPIVAGITSLNDIPADQLPTKFSRAYRDSDPPQYYEIENAAIILKAKEEPIPLYRKSKLVPGAEIFPYKNILPFLKPLVDQLGGTTAGLATQEKRMVFESNTLKIAPVICYESIYGQFVRDYIKLGAQAIFIMTNDGWWDDTPGYKQHLAFGALRAIEFRKPVIRSANTGISCFINARGQVSHSTKYGKEAGFYANCTFSDAKTIYAYFGDWIAYLALILGAILIIYSFFLKFTNSLPRS